MGDLESLQLADLESVYVNFKISYLQGFIVALPESPLQLLFPEPPAHTIFSVRYSTGGQNSPHFSFVIKGRETYCRFLVFTKKKVCTHLHEKLLHPKLNKQIIVEAANNFYKTGFTLYEKILAPKVL